MSIDLLIVNDDLVLSGIGEPALISSTACVSQDLRHMLRENGYLVSLIGERNPVTIVATTKSIELEMEEDARIYPGSAEVAFTNDTLLCTARTVDNDEIKVML